MLGRVFGPNRDEVTGGWRKLHREKFYNLYSSPSLVIMTKSGRIELGSACSTKGEKEECL
jgi:hypothetical protein